MYSKQVTHTDRRAPRRVKKSKDRRIFSKTADMTHKMNLNSGRPMRGGIRL